MNDESLEALAERLAARGHEALAEQLRTAFAQAAAAHADIVQMDEEKLETVVQNYLPRADGLQWRRALATIAAEELGIELGAAIGHPAVARAQELVGAPSYEESLSALVRRSGPENSDAELTAHNGRQDETAQDDQGVREYGGVADADYATPEPEAYAPVQPETNAPAEPDAYAPPEPEVYTPPEPGSYAPPEPEPEPEPHAPPEPEPYTPPETETYAPPEPPTQPRPAWAPATAAGEQAPTPEPAVDQDGLQLTAIHLGGVANLSGTRQSVEVRISQEGFDILRDDGQIVGRLEWGDIESLEVPAPRGLLRKRTGAPGQLVVRTQSGDASFEISTFSTDELRERVDALVERFARH